MMKRFSLSLVLALAACGDGARDQPPVEQTPSPTVLAPPVDSTELLPADTTESATAAQPDPVPPGRLMTPWAYLADSADAARSWFVLRERQSLTELIPSKLQLIVTPGPCSETGQGAKPMAINGAWIVMLSDVPGLRAGAIDTGTIMRPETRSPDLFNDTLTFSFRGERFVLSTERVNEQGFRLSHHGKGGRLILFSTETQDEGKWDPSWVGDLNRDGAPDILMEITPKHSVRSQVLYLSGALQSNGRWWPAAIYSQAGC